jgi:hypothetical protein
MYLDVGLIHAPGVVGRFELGADTLFQFGRIALNPALDGGVVDMETARGHHFLKIAIAQAGS